MRHKRYKQRSRVERPSQETLRINTIRVMNAPQTLKENAEFWGCRAAKFAIAGLQQASYYAQIAAQYARKYLEIVESQRVK